MMDQIIKEILKAEEKANEGISEASMKAEQMKDTIEVPQDELFDKKIATCKEEAKIIRESAKQNASEESKKIMEECENELAVLESQARKHMRKQTGFKNIKRL
jgi:vacuolar-type H+-ATPase subunit H